MFTVPFKRLFLHVSKNNDNKRKVIDFSNPVIFSNLSHFLKKNLRVKKVILDGWLINIVCKIAFQSIGRTTFHLLCPKTQCPRQHHSTITKLARLQLPTNQSINFNFILFLFLYS